jgi:hypothetical protein
MVFLLAFSLGASVLALIWLMVLSLSLRRSRKLQRLLPKGEETELTGLIGSFAVEGERLKAQLAKLREEHQAVSELLRGTVQKIGVVRFDAFEDMGGNLSFAAALLNGQGDGIVICAINGRNESRTYAKPVKGGNSVYNLSEEERKAIDKAMSYTLAGPQ